MKREEEFDRLVNDALAEYRDAEPLAGLDDRVLRRLNVAAAPQRMKWHWLAVPALALLTLLVWLGARHPPIRQPAPEVAAQKTPAAVVQPQPMPERVVEKPVVSHRARQRSQRTLNVTATAASPTTPVRNQFPSPAPLNHEERALLALVENDPGLLERLAREKTSNDIEPITIKPLENVSASEGED
jgi:hypothetical protein